MAKRFGARCRCCGIPAAQLELNCTVCEAPYDNVEGFDPLLYGEPIAIVVESLIGVVRNQEDAAKALVSKWRTAPAEVLKASDFEGVSQITGAILDDASVLASANAAASGWLLEGSNKHVPPSFPLLYERYFVETVFDDPEGLSYLGLLESVGIKGHNRELSQYPSEAHSQRHRLFVERDLEILAALEKQQEGSSAPPEEQVSVGILKWMLNNFMKGVPFEHHAYALDQMDGMHQMIQMTMTDLTPVRTLQDGWNYVQRLQKFPARFKLVHDELLLQKEKGILPPKFVVEKILKSVTKIKDELVASVEESAMYTSLIDKLTGEDGAGLKDVPQELKDKAKETLATDVVAAYSSLEPPLKSLLDTVSADGYVDHAGVQALPNGPAYYSWALSSQTSSSMSPDEVHALGHSQVASIMTEMKDVIERLAPKDSCLDPNLGVPENIRKLQNNGKWTYADSQEGKDNCLTDFKTLIAEISEIIDPLFDMRPKQPIKVMPVPKHMEEGAPAAFYMPPSLDGTRDGVFHVNLGDMSAQYKFGMRTLTAHEGIPGHHFQIALQYEMKGLPHFRKTSENFNAFIEGWALYTEKLARELNFYATEPDGSEGYDLLGHFGDELMRAARLVVDTGLHYYGWDREKAMDYMRHHTILAESDVETEVDRYCVLPGQACSYKVGQLAILKLRADLKEKLGGSYSDRVFHRCLLSGGAIPITMLSDMTATMLR